MFSDITFTVAHPHVGTETVTPEVSKLRKFWHTVTRKPLPTITVPVIHTHSLTVDESTDFTQLVDIASAVEDQGYTIVSVQVHSRYGSDELIRNEAIGNLRAPNFSEALAFLAVMQDDSDNWAGHVATLSAYGWDASRDESWLEDHGHGAWQSPEEFAMNFFTDTAEHVERSKGPYGYEKETISVYDALPVEVTIDWADTAWNMECNGWTFTRYNGETHVFDY